MKRLASATSSFFPVAQLLVGLQEHRIPALFDPAHKTFRLLDVVRAKLLELGETEETWGEGAAFELLLMLHAVLREDLPRGHGTRGFVCMM